jgi:hypothetical protein
MTRAELEHIIRAAGTIADDDVIVIGSQAVLGQFPDAPPELLVSEKADVYPRQRTDRSDLIDGSIGDSSPFHREFGYFAHGVGPETAVLPEGWRDRLVLVCGENTPFVRGWCLEVHDLAISKFVAGREKDLDFTQSLVRHAMVSRETLEQRLDATAVDDDTRALVARRIEAQFTSKPAPRSAP